MYWCQQHNTRTVDRRQETAKSDDLHHIIRRSQTSVLDVLYKNLIKKYTYMINQNNNDVFFSISEFLNDMTSNKMQIGSVLYPLSRNWSTVVKSVALSCASTQSRTTTNIPQQQQKSSVHNWFQRKIHAASTELHPFTSEVQHQPSLNIQSVRPRTRIGWPYIEISGCSKLANPLCLYVRFVWLMI